MMPDIARPDKADNVKKKVSPLLDYGDTFQSFAIKQNCQRGDKKL